MKEVIVAGDNRLVNMIVENSNLLLQHGQKRNSDLIYKDISEFVCQNDPTYLFNSDEKIKKYISFLEKGIIKSPEAVVWSPEYQDSINFFRELKHMDYDGKKILVYCFRPIFEQHGEFADKSIYTLGEPATLTILNFLGYSNQ